jgi:O-antigen ligase
MESLVRRSRYRSALGILAPCVYLAGCGFPFKPDLPLLLLAGLGSIAISSRADERAARAGSPLLLGIKAFVVATALSIAASIDPARSLRLSAPLIPALLIVALATRRWDPRIPHSIYATCAAVSLGLCLAVMWMAIRSDWRSLHDRVSEIGSPLLVEANDIAFVAIVAPLALALRSVGRRALSVLGTASIITAAVAIGVLQSRVATLTLAVSTATYAWLIRGSWSAAGKRAAAMLIAVFVVDATLGLPLTTKFQRVHEPRFGLWAAAVGAFVDAPVLGSGPHTFGIAARRSVAAGSVPSWLPRTRRIPPWAHNLYVEVLAERGVVGFAALVGLLLLAWREIRRLLRDAVPPARTLVAGVAASLTGFCFAAIFELSFIRLWVVVLFFTLLALVSQLSARKER